MGKNKTPKNRPLITVRTAVVLLTATLLTAAAFGLTFASTGSLPAAVLAAGGAFLPATRWANHIIE